VYGTGLSCEVKGMRKREGQIEKRARGERGKHLGSRKKTAKTSLESPLKGETKASVGKKVVKGGGKEPT